MKKHLAKTKAGITSMACSAPFKKGPMLSEKEFKKELKKNPEECCKFCTKLFNKTYNK